VVLRCFGAIENISARVPWSYEISYGLFFAISGANKLFARGTKPVYETLVKAKVPFPHPMACFVSGVEFFGGSLTWGFFRAWPAWLYWSI
jgi:uncharacterized membrane protein YphA (DoxX/SURF4 family)